MLLLQVLSQITNPNQDCNSLSYVDNGKGKFLKTISQHCKCLQSFNLYHFLQQNRTEKMISNAQLFVNRVRLEQQGMNQSFYENQNIKKAKMASPYVRWTRQQDVLYVRFLKFNMERMKKTHFRKPYNKFKKMAEYVTSKDSFQCRSHHQKMVKKFGSIEGIVENLSITTSKYFKKDKTAAQTIVFEENELESQKISKSQIPKGCMEKNNQQIKIQKLIVQKKPKTNQQKQMPSDQSIHIANLSSENHQKQARGRKQGLNGKNNDEKLQYDGKNKYNGNIQQYENFQYDEKMQYRRKTQKSQFPCKQIEVTNTCVLEPLRCLNDNQNQKLNYFGPTYDSLYNNFNIFANSNNFSPMVNSLSNLNFNYEMTKYWQQMTQMNQCINWMKFNYEQAQQIKYTDPFPRFQETIPTQNVISQVQKPQKNSINAEDEVQFKDSKTGNFLPSDLK